MEYFRNIWNFILNSKCLGTVEELIQAYIQLQPLCDRLCGILIPWWYPAQHLSRHVLFFIQVSIIQSGGRALSMMVWYGWEQTCRLMCSTELTLHVSGCRYTRKYYCVKSILTGMSLFAVQIDPPLPCFVNLIYASALLKHCFSFSNRELCGFFHLINTLV